MWRRWLARWSHDRFWVWFHQLTWHWYWRSGCFVVFSLNSSLLASSLLLFSSLVFSIQLDSTELRALRPLRWSCRHNFYKKFKKYYIFYIRGSKLLIQTRFSALEVTSKPPALPLFILVTKTPQLIPDFFNPYCLMRAGWDSDKSAIQLCIASVSEAKLM